MFVCHLCKYAFFLIQQKKNWRVATNCNILRDKKRKGSPDSAVGRRAEGPSG